MIPTSLSMKMSPLDSKPHMSDIKYPWKNLNRSQAICTNVIHSICEVGRNAVEEGYNLGLLKNTIRTSQKYAERLLKNCFF